MQDRYAGDVGDFLTFGLLRWIVPTSGEPAPGATPHRLGVVWYRVPDESHNGDGKHVTYLDPTSKLGVALRPLDPDLHERLAAMMSTGERSIARVEEAGVLPGDVVTFDELLTFEGLDPAAATPLHRAAHRAAWADRAQAAMVDCTIVFVDPDNGVRRRGHTTASSPRTAIKHAYYDELSPFVERGQSVIAYQHADRTAKVGEQAMRRMGDAADELGIEPLAAVRASRGSTRLFLVLPVPEHREHLASRLHELSASPWGRELGVIWWERTRPSPASATRAPRRSGR